MMQEGCIEDLQGGYQTLRLKTTITFGPFISEGI